MALTEKYVSTAGGGAHDGSSEANAFTWAEMVTDINAGGKAGNRYNLKADATYSRTTTTDTISGAGSTTAPVIIRGYSSTIGDGYLGRTNGNGPLITTNMPSITYSTGRINCTGAYIIFECLNLSGANNGYVLEFGAPRIFIARSSVVNSGTGASAAAIAAYDIGCTCYNIDAALTGASGGLVVINASYIGVRVIASRVSAVSTSPNCISAYQTLVYGCVVKGGNRGIYQNTTAGASHFVNNTITGAAGDGIGAITGLTYPPVIFGNIISDNGGYGINMTDATCVSFLANNRFRDNTSGATNGGTDWVAATGYGHVTTDTGGPETDFVNAASGDYSLIAASPAVGAGLPAYADIGALQRVAEAGGGVLAHPGLRGGFLS